MKKGVDETLLTVLGLSDDNYKSYHQARRRVPPLNTQCLQNSAESGEWSTLTLGFLCLPCYMQDKA